MVVAQALYKIPRQEFDVVELGKIENMRLGQHGGGNIERQTNFRQIVKKTGISQPFVFLVNEILFYMSVRHKFRPNTHNPFSYRHKVYHLSPKK